MIRKILSTIFLLVLILTPILASSPASPAQAATGLPNYQLQFLGNGSPVAINASGVVAGARLNASSNYEPLVSSGGATWTLLPLPSGYVSVFPTDINDSGVIVGVAYTAQWVSRAVRWLPSAGSYTVELLPLLSGDTNSYANGINNLGQIVGARGSLGYTPTGMGWLYSDQGGLVNLYATYGLATYPTELNDVGKVLSGTEWLDLNTGVLELLPPGPSNYNAIPGRYINNNNQVAGATSLRSTSLNIISVFRLDPGTGWTFIAGTSKYTVVSSLNSLGDVGYGEQGSGLYLDGQGTFALNNLLDPAVVAAGWAITGSSPKINDQRQVAAVGKNSQTGQSGGVLLSPTGALQPPSAPANLQGQAHSGSASEPWNSIDLTWQNTSSLTNSYELERRVNGETAWTLLVTPTNTSYQDTSVGVAITYDYRVRAVGLAGPSEWSNTATVTSPTVPLDTTPPVVSILTPANGATVSGTVTVTAQATDNVGVTYLEISFWNQYTGQEVILGSVQNSGSLSVNWNTSGLTPATYALHAYATDALNNWSRSEINVNVTGSSTKSLTVTSINMTSSVRGSTATVSGTVTVKDNTGQAVSGATVNVEWKLPNNTTRTASGVTSSNGTVKFTTSGPRGTYTLKVTNVSKSGYQFDSANSILSKSITTR